MSFFPPDPELPPQLDEDHPQPEWAGPPDDELPSVMPVATTLATSTHAAISLIGVHVHRKGVEFRLRGNLRRLDLPAREWNELCSSFLGHHHAASPQEHRDRLRYGAELADGERVFAEPFYVPSAGPTESQGHVLSRLGAGGGGGGRTYSLTDGLWLWPLPPPGPIELVVQWPAVGIGEHRVTIDAAQIESLAERARPLWE